MIISQKNFIKITAKTNGRCFYCNIFGEVIDHFVSKKKWHEWELEKVFGSPDKVENLFLACASCNSSKNDKCPEDFMEKSIWKPRGNTEKGEESSYKSWDRYQRANLRIGIKT